MVRISSFSNRQVTRIDERVQSGSITTGTEGSVAKAVSNVSSDINRIATRLVEEEKQHIAKLEVLERSRNKRKELDAIQEEAINNYDVANDRVIIKGKDTGQDLHQYIKEQSRLYDNQTSDIYSSNTAKRLWETSNQDMLNSSLVKTTARRFEQRRKYGAVGMDKTTEDTSKNIQNSQGNMTIGEYKKQILQGEESFAALRDMVSPSVYAAKYKKFREESAKNYIDSKLDNGRLSDVIDALMITNPSKTKGERDFELTEEWLKIAQGNEDKIGRVKRSVKYNNGVTALVGEKGTLEIHNDGTVLVNDEGTRVTEDGRVIQVDIPLLYEKGAYKVDMKEVKDNRDSTVYDNLSDNDYAVSLDRLGRELEKGLKKSSASINLTQRQLIDTLSDPNKATRRTVDPNNPDDPLAVEFNNQIEKINNNSEFTEQQKHTMIGALYAANEAGKTYSRLDKLSAKDSKRTIENLGNRLDFKLKEQGIEIPEATKASISRQYRKNLDAYDAVKNKNLPRPEYMMSVDPTLNKLFVEGSENGDFSKYNKRLDKLRNDAEVPLYAPRYPKAYTTGLVQQIKNISESGTAGALEAQGLIKRLRAGSGEHFPTLWKELEAAGLPSDYNILGALPSTVEGDRAGATVISNINNRKVIQKSFKEANLEDHRDNLQGLSKAVQSKMSGMGDYFLKSHSLSSGVSSFNAFKQSVMDEAMKSAVPLINGNSTLNYEDIANAAYNKIIHRNFVLDNYNGLNMMMSKGDMQQNNMTEEEVKAAMEYYSNKENTWEMLGLGKMLSSKFKNQLKEVGITSDNFKEEFIEGKFGELQPMFSDKGIAFKLIPSNSAIPFTALNNQGGLLLIPYADVKANEKVREAAKGVMIKANEAANKYTPSALDRGK